MKDFEEFTDPLETDSERDSERSTEQTVNVQCMEGFTPKEAARTVGVSERTVFKYADTLIPLWGEEKIRSDGLYTEFAIAQMKRIKEMKPARYAKEVRRELGLPEEVSVEVLPPDETRSALAIRKESTLAVQNCSSEVYAATAAEYAALDDIEAQMTQELEAMYAEFNELDEALETSREQEEAIGNRRAAMRGMRRAMGEANTEKKQYVSVTNGLRNQQAGKDEGFRQSS